MSQQIKYANTINIEEYKCKSCKIYKPKIFFSSTNGKMNDKCKKCNINRKLSVV